MDRNRLIVGKFWDGLDCRMIHLGIVKSEVPVPLGSSNSVS